MLGLYLQEGEEEENNCEILGEVIAKNLFNKLSLLNFFDLINKYDALSILVQLEEPLGQQVERLSMEALPSGSKKVSSTKAKVRRKLYYV